MTVEDVHIVAVLHNFEYAFVLVCLFFSSIVTTKSHQLSNSTNLQLESESLQSNVHVYDIDLDVEDELYVCVCARACVFVSLLCRFFD